jgi:hypothetical protein
MLGRLGSDSLQEREASEQSINARLRDPDFCHEISGQAEMVVNLIASPDASVRALALVLLRTCWKDLPNGALAAVTNAAMDSDEDTAREAIADLARAPHRGEGAAAALKAVRTEAHDRHGRTLGQALATLADLGAWDDDIAAITLQALDDADAQWGACIIIARQGVRRPDLAPRLSALVSDQRTESETRAEAMNALAMAGDPKVVAPQLAGILADTHENTRQRQAATIALQNMGADAKSVLPIVEQVAKNEDDTDVRLAAQALERNLRSY